jgi:hypothetical protein
MMFARPCADSRRVRRRVTFRTARPARRRATTTPSPTVPSRSSAAVQLRDERRALAFELLDLGSDSAERGADRSGGGVEPGGAATGWHAGPPGG